MLLQTISLKKPTSFLVGFYFTFHLLSRRKRPSTRAPQRHRYNRTSAKPRRRLSKFLYRTPFRVQGEKAQPPKTPRQPSTYRRPPTAIFVLIFHRSSFTPLSVFRVSIRRRQRRLIIGIHHKPCLCLGRLFHEPFFAVIDGDLIPHAPVRIIGANLCREFNHVIGHASPVRQNEHVRRVVFLGMQPNIFGARILHQAVVLQVVSTRENGKSLIGKFSIGSNEFLFLRAHLFFGSFQQPQPHKLRLNLFQIGGRIGKQHGRKYALSVLFFFYFLLQNRGQNFLRALQFIIGLKILLSVFCGGQGWI